MKKGLFPLLFAVLLVTVFSGCSAGAKKIERNLSNYEIQAVFDDGDMSLTCTQKVDWINAAEVPVSALSFNLYANGYRKDAAVRPVTAEQVYRAYPNGPDYGGIEISAVKLNGKECSFTIQGQDQNELTVQFGSELYPDERATVEMEYRVELANIKHRLGYAANTVNLGNFYPVACVYEDGGYRAYPYYANGDPFYSQAANYRVTLSSPAGYEIAATGNLTAETKADGRTVRTYSAGAVRDFAMVLSKKFKRIEGKQGDVMVQYYYFSDEDPQSSLQIAKQSVATFSEKFGKYPYSQLSVAETDFMQGGMEYPNLIYISTDCDAATYREVIVHETAHQWWYGVVGNNEVEDAWMDEGLTEFSTAYFYHANPSYQRTMQEFAANAKLSYRAYLKLLVSMNLTPDTSMARSLDQFKNEYEYVTMTYAKGQLLFHDLYSMLGEEKFLKSLKSYYQSYRFCNASPEDMIASFEKNSGRTLEGWFVSWTEGKNIL